MAAAMTPRAGTAVSGAAAAVPNTVRTMKDMTIQEMERALEPNPMRRPAEIARPGCAPQTARALLEENKQLIEEKRERKALQRKNSREYVEKLLLQDRLTIEGDKARELGRRHAQRELAQYYKAKIAEKEEQKAKEYQSKVEKGREIQYFPFVEGENIDKSREMKSARLREEMRGFLQRDREAKPPRADSLLADTTLDNSLQYPVAPRAPVLKRAAPAVEASSGDVDEAGAVAATSSAQPRPLAAVQGTTSVTSGGIVPTGHDVAPHLARHPRFLTRAQEHMSRRIHDVHVRKALEDKVLQTKAELEELERKRRLEAAQWEDGLLVHDALRYDSSKAKNEERRRHAQFLQQQIEERRTKEQEEKVHKQAESAGYWGPMEKEAQDPQFHREHCSDLIKQMEVDQHRRLNSRNQRLRQERRLIDNSIAAMCEDREKERQKFNQHREVLVTTWKSQQKIREAIRTIENL